MSGEKPGIWGCVCPIANIKLRTGEHCVPEMKSSDCVQVNRSGGAGGGGGQDDLSKILG
jgi:hypothetical protein